MVYADSRFRFEFSGNADFFERVSNVLLKPGRWSIGFKCDLITVKSQLDNKIAKIFAGCIAAFLFPFTLLGLLLNYYSKSHQEKYRLFTIKPDFPEPPKDTTPAIPDTPLLRPATMPHAAQISPLNLLAQIDTGGGVGTSDLETLLEAPPACTRDRSESDASWDRAIENASPVQVLEKIDQSIAKLTFSERFHRLVNWVSEHAITLCKGVKNFFKDEDHPWKQQKYALIMEALQPTFQANLNLKECPQSQQKETLAFSICEMIDFGMKKVTNHREQHHGLLALLRAIIKSKEFADAKLHPDQFKAELNAVYSLCYSLYKDVEIHSFCTNLVKELITEGRKVQEMPIAAEQAARLSVKEQFEAIESAPHQYGADRMAVVASNFLGATNMSFDPATLGNMAHVLYHLPSHYFGNEMTCLRFGTPTISGFVPGTSEIDPIFTCFLEEMKRRGESHVYFSLQDGRGLTPDSESAQHSFVGDLDRTAAISRLEDTNFSLVVFAQDSEFYHQKGKWSKEEIPVLPFMMEFLEQIRSTEHGYYFPKAVSETQDFKESLALIIADVHEAVFEGKENLTRSDRKDFIELVHLFLTIHILKKLKPTTFNLSCKDAIDRAGKQNRLLFELLTWLSNTEGSDEFLEEAKMTITHAPAFIVKKQAMLLERRERMESVLHCMKKPGVRERVVECLMRKFDFQLGEIPQFKLFKGQELATAPS